MVGVAGGPGLSVLSCQLMSAGWSVTHIQLRKAGVLKAFICGTAAKLVMKSKARKITVRPMFPQVLLAVVL